MDGGRARGVLLLPATHFCPLANCGGDFGRNLWRRDVHFSSSVNSFWSAVAELRLNAGPFQKIAA